MREKRERKREEIERGRERERVPGRGGLKGGRKSMRAYATIREGAFGRGRFFTG